MSWILDKFSQLQSAFESFVPLTVSAKTVNYADLKVTELKTLAKEKGLKGYTGLRKAELIEVLKQN